MAFVAPMLPLPTLRMSMPFAFATRNPVGIEPSRYARERDQDVSKNWHGGKSSELT